ncbi:MAG: radical SAM protein [Desulfobacterales bacterium]|nr:radical SAM protein [Desulfobacterales bacterium]
MKILLIYPYCLEERINADDSEVVPMGLFNVAAVLKDAGHDVQVLNWHNLRGNPDAVQKALTFEQPDVVGLSILHANRWGGIEIARLAKKVNPDIRTVFGGIGASLLWEHFLTHFPEIDFIVTGEGEYTLAGLVSSLEKGHDNEIAALPGVAYRQKGAIKCNLAAPLIKDLDSLPDPARHFDFQHIALTRGCPGDCSFCGSPEFWQRKVRFHSAGNFVDRIERLYRRGTTFFYFSDDTITLRKKLILDVCSEIRRRKMSITWAAISRVDTVDAEILAAMRRAGCIQISYGVESADEGIRRLLNKKTDANQIRRAFKLTARHGIMTRAYFIYGCPGESWETTDKNIALIREIKPLSAIFYILDIFPGTKLYREYLERTGETDDIWLDRIEDILYFETDPDLSREQVLAFGKKLRTSFFADLPGFVEDLKLKDDPRLAPYHADFCSRLGMTFDQGDYSENHLIPDREATALKLYQKALAYHPDARAYLGLGMLKQRRRAFSDSIKVLAEGVEFFPDNAQISICLAVSQMNLGQFDRALGNLLRFETSPQAGPFIEQCRRALSGA